ncbi:uncharacterized protein YneR [Oikeobacillus pervagus]|uniref:Uncharacterized protein YneR n=1 Tax=Oikeobacillus pervagus TaxID=1325931 RepID=A0AAJ1SZC2_9BACI|nr:HesB/YadR/YfhF family protein [Oikeobacillus pervagus]MDQ0214046.1 uncharacterized protein YneR [Oikeobacillus pervagus]
MNIILSDRAFQWFKNEMEAKKGDFIRFYARYGGASPLHEAFSLGVNKEEPFEIGTKLEYEGITFFIEENDLWFFDEHDLHVQYCDKLDELEFHYLKN